MKENYRKIYVVINPSEEIRVWKRDLMIKWSNHRFEKATLEVINTPRVLDEIWTWDDHNGVGVTGYDSLVKYSLTAVSPYARGKGLGTEMLRLRKEVLASIGIELVSKVAPTNQASLRMCEKAGVRVR